MADPNAELPANLSNNNSNMNWMDYIKNPLILGLLGFLGNYMNNQQAKDVYTPRQAMSGINNLNNNPFTSMMNSSLQGNPASSTTQGVQNAVTQRQNQQFTAPTLNTPQRYDPYSGDNATMGGSVNPQLLQSVLSLANRQTLTPADTTFMQNNMANRGSAEARAAMLSNLQNRGTPEANAAMLANLQNRGNDTLFNNLYNRYSQRFGG